MVQSLVRILFSFVSNSLSYSTVHGHCSTYTHVNCLQYGGLPWKIHAKTLRVKFLHELLHADFLHANLSVFLWWLILLTKIHASCVYLFYNRQCAWCKIRNQHCGRTSFRGERENNLLYTFTANMLRSQTSCFIINDFLGCWLKRYFTCKLGCMLLATTVVLQ